ncbi:MAG: hypothetical protein K5778_09375 [Bacteroidaceae bacterium]|nr:hypothetical protein [Bacteroidaceae bacterium]
MKPKYITPIQQERTIALPAPILQGSIAAPGEDIGYGGEGDDDDDPTAKERTEIWGTLW